MKKRADELPEELALNFEGLFSDLAKLVKKWETPA